MLDQYVCNGQPVILNVTTTRDHFVVASGQTTVGNDDTYSIADPGGNNATLLGGYANQYKGLRLFTSTQQPLNALVITGHSPIELQITAPNGAVTGFLNGEVINNIPGRNRRTLILRVADYWGQVTFSNNHWSEESRQVRPAGRARRIADERDNYSKGFPTIQLVVRLGW